VASLLLALGSALALVPLAMAAARRTGLVDRPSARKLHPGPTPLLGGGAILGGIAAGVLVVSPGYGPAVAVALLVALLGLWDDVRGASPWTRLVVEFLASLALVELTRTQLWFPPFLPVQAARVITALWLVGVTNAANCFDCADGSLAGSGAVIALGIAACAAVAGSDAIDPALALAGALVGFLVYNRPPARIFMGDAGSLPVGLLLGWLGVRVASGTLAAFSLAALLLVSVPVFDFLAVHVRRLRRGREGIWEVVRSTGCDHLPHRLAARNGPRGGLRRLYLLHLGSGAMAVGAALSPSPWPGLGLLFVWVSLLLWLDLWLPGEAPAARRATEDDPLARSHLAG